MSTAAVGTGSVTLKKCPNHLLRELGLAKRLAIYKHPSAMTNLAIPGDQGWLALGSFPF